MKKVIRLTESELTSLIKNIVNETEMNEQTVNPEVMETGDAILTIALTVIGMLGFAGYDILRDMAKKLMKKGKKQEAHQLISFIDEHESGEEEHDTYNSQGNFEGKRKSMGDMDTEEDSPMMESRIVRRRR
jgi:hypothetical protein